MDCDLSGDKILEVVYFLALDPKQESCLFRLRGTEAAVPQCAFSIIPGNFRAESEGEKKYTTKSLSCFM